MASTIETRQTVEEVSGEYKYGFVTDIEMVKAPKGLSEEVIRFISEYYKEEIDLFGYDFNLDNIYEGN
mgnify:CR=1 FL=1